MIFDKLENLKKYNIVPDEVLKFLYGANTEIPQGRYEFSNGIYANAEVFNTKCQGDLEAHRDYIDIHIILSGSERIDFCDKAELAVKVPYIHDIEFYYDPQKPLGSVYLVPGKFAVFYPNEAHKPQLNSAQDVSIEVRKVVVKIPV